MPPSSRRTLGKCVSEQSYRGFESHSLRHYQHLFDISTNHNFSGVSVCHTLVTNDKIFTMKTLIATAFAVLMFFSLEMTAPQSSDAGVTCSTDVFGNYNCSSSDGSYSTTTTDVFGNDNTSFSDGSTMSCYTDVFGNYVCN